MCRSMSLPGELHAIVGENGAGKSTLMKILAGVITDFEGELLLRGQPVALSRHARRRSRPASASFIRS